MTPEQTFGQLLGRGNAWRVVEARLDVNSSTFVVRVEETPELWPLESARAGTPVTCHDHVQPMQWRHLNVFNKECVIVCALPRGRRGDDGKAYRVTPPWEGRSKHFTQEFEAFALTLMREMPVKRAGQILGESDSRMWRKNRVNWTEKETQKWESMALERCVTGMAYEMRRVLQGIYEWKDAEEARKMFGNGCAWVQTMREPVGGLLEPMARAARTIEGHMEGILAHWTQGLTTAFMEGLNSLLSTVKRRARGYRSVEYMTAMLHFVAGKLSLPCY